MKPNSYEIKVVKRCPNPQESYLLSSILPYLHIRVNDNRIRKLIAPSHGSLD